MKKENRLLTIDGETLMSQPLTPLNFVVDTLLSQGLHILAGSPKVGKSWLALWLAVTVARTTLYLCLEDSTLRIQNRLFRRDWQRTHPPALTSQPRAASSARDWENSLHVPRGAS